MSLVKVGRNTLHHWAVKSALQQAQRQREVEQRRYDALQQGDTLNGRCGLAFQPWLVGHHDQDQTDDAAGRGPGELDEKEVKGEVHP